MSQTSHRPAFLPLESDLDGELEQLARAKGVGTFARPAPVEPGAGPSADLTPPAPDTEDQTGQAGQPTPRSRMKTLNLELPDYAWTEIKIRAVHRQTSLRHVVMEALVADGITIAEADMVEDGRRLR